MRFIIKREELLKALNIASRAVASKVAVAVLANYKFELTSDGLFITGSNYDITIKTGIPYRCGDTEIIRDYKEGGVLLNAKNITDLTRKLEDPEIRFEVLDSTICLITCGSSEYKFNCVRVDEYPDLDLEANGTNLTLTKGEFDTLVSQTSFAASTKEQRPMLTAINLEAGNGVLVATTTDTARMARKEIQIPSDVSFVANVPAKMMVEVDHLLEGLDSLNIAFSDKKALFTLGGSIIATRLIAGDYPNTKNIVPKIINHSLEVNASALTKAIDRANIFSSERENVVDLSVNEDGLQISAKAAQQGSGSEKIELHKFEGNPIRISFNSEYVIAAVRALGSEDVTLEFVGEMKPFVVKNAKDSSVIQIVTPVRTY